MIVFDVETTGLPKAEGSDLDMQPQIIEFGAIKLDDDLKEIDRTEFFCNPNQPLPEIIKKITGITDGQLKDEKPFVAYYQQLCEFFLGETTMVAHNLPFDRKLLKFELERMDKLTAFPWPYKHICTVEISQAVWGKRRKLVDLYEEITGKPHKGAHRATADVEALIEVLKWYRKEGHA